LAHHLLIIRLRQVVSINHKKVLIVDDDKLLAYVIQAILEGEGYEVRTAGDGEQGYSIYLVFRPDIVVADIWMPRKNGLEMMEQIRTACPEVRTVYMSGAPDPVRTKLEDERKKFRASTLKKPFSREELTGLIFGLSQEAPGRNLQRIKEET
jgi:CheY-like chemotaxis protein